MARPLDLLALVGVIALLVGFAVPGHAYAQEGQPQPGDRPPELVGSIFDYFFKHGAEWDNRYVGYICRGVVINGKPHLDKHPEVEQLIFEGMPGDSVFVDQVGDPKVFEFAAGPGVPSIHRYVLSDGRTEPIDCTSEKSGELTRQFHVRYYPTAGGLFEFDIVGCVSFVLEGHNDERTNEFGVTATADSGGPLKDGPRWASLTNLLSVTHDVNDVNGWLDEKRVSARIEALTLIQFEDTLTRRAAAVSEGIATVQGEVTSDIPTVQEVTVGPTEAPLKDDVMRVNFPFTVPGRFQPWEWHKNGDGPFNIGEERFISVSAAVTAEVKAGDTVVTTTGTLKERLARLKAKCPFVNRE